MGDGRLVVEYLRESDARCSGCGYSLRGAAEARCPECGAGVRLAVDAGASGRGWWLFAVMGSGVAAALAAGALWVCVRHAAEHVASTSAVMVREGFQPRLSMRWQEVALAAGLTVLMLALAAWAWCSRRGFSRWSARRRVATGLALGVLPAAVSMVVWLWAVRR